MKTILITGCSSGFGLEIARYFLDRDWKVVATMRGPREDVLPRSEHLRVLALDVTDPESIRQAVEAAGPIDVLVNKALARHRPSRPPRWRRCASSSRPTPSARWL